MRYVLPSILTPLFLGIGLASPLYSADAVATQALINTYCVSCHGDEESEGNLRLDFFGEKRWDDYDLIDAMVSRIEDGEMPPRDASKPLSKADGSQLLAALTTQLKALDIAQLSGRYKKITAVEYSNTLDDVFGFPINTLSDLPFDSEHDIKKLGEHQVVTSYAVKKYYAAAHEYLEQHLIHESMEPRETKFSAKNGKDLFGRQYTSTLGAVAGGGNPPIFVLKSPVTSYAEEGEYELAFDWYCFYGPRDKPEQHEHVKPIRTPHINYHRNRTNSRVLNPVKQFENDRIASCSMDEPIRIFSQRT